MSRRTANYLIGKEFKDMRAAIFLILLATQLLLIVGCEKKGVVVQKEGRLYAPISSQELSLIIVPGLSVHELTNRCGTPSQKWQKENGVEIYSFRLSSDRLKPTKDWVIAEIGVVVSNGVVRFWWPTGHTQVRGIRGRNRVKP